jgi:ubiquinone/menaquinone biosynthesis C-methylase UbiE
VSVSDKFDRAAATYEDGPYAGWYRAQARELLPLLPLRPGCTVLDIGCGTGWLLRQLVRHCPGVRGIGVDASPAMIATARQKASAEGVDGLRFACADWERDELATMELAPRQVDVAVCASAFHYFSQPEQALSRVARSLSLEGMFYLLDRATDGSILTATWDLLHRAFIRDQVRFYRETELVRLLAQAGFRDVRTVRRIRRLLWQGKFDTSVVILEAAAPSMENRATAGVRQSR